MILYNMKKKNLLKLQKGGTPPREREVVRADSIPDDWEDQIWDDSGQGLPAAAPDDESGHGWEAVPIPVESEQGWEAAAAEDEGDALINVFKDTLHLNQEQVTNLKAYFIKLNEELQDYIIDFIGKIQTQPIPEIYQKLVEIVYKLIIYNGEIRYTVNDLQHALKIIVFEQDPFKPLDATLKSLLEIIFNKRSDKFTWVDYILNNDQIERILAFTGPIDLKFYTNIIDLSKTRQFKKKYLDFKIYGEKDAKADSSAGSLYYGDNSIEINDPNVNNEADLINFIRNNLPTEIYKLIEPSINSGQDFMKFKDLAARLKIVITKEEAAIYKQLRILWNQRNNPTIGIYSSYDADKKDHKTIQDYLYSIMPSQYSRIVFPQLKEPKKGPKSYLNDIRDKEITICGRKFRVGDIRIKILHKLVNAALDIILRGISAQTRILKNFYYSTERDAFYFVFQPGQGGILNMKLLGDISQFFQGLNGRLHISLPTRDRNYHENLHATFEHYLLGKQIKSYLYLNDLNHSNSIREGNIKFPHRFKHYLLDYSVTEMQDRKETYFNTGVYSTDSKSVTHISDERRVRVYELLSDIMVEFLNSLFGSLTPDECRKIEPFVQQAEADAAAARRQAEDAARRQAEAARRQAEAAARRQAEAAARTRNFKLDRKSVV